MSEAEFTEGVCGDGAAILRDGERLTISEVLDLLNTSTALTAENQRLRLVLAEANNLWRHSFSATVERAADELFSKLSFYATVGRAPPIRPKR